jgi:hypothetical protein
MSAYTNFMLEQIMDSIERERDWHVTQSDAFIKHGKKAEERAYFHALIADNLREAMRCVDLALENAKKV